jgi:protease I
LDLSTSMSQYRGHFPSAIAPPDRSFSGFPDPAWGTPHGQGGSAMTSELNNVRVAFVVANEGIEEVELTEPWTAVMNAGGSPQLVAPKSGEAQAMNHLDKADKFSVDRTTAEVTVDDFDAVVLPGGVANPDQLRLDDAAVNFVKAMCDAGKPVAAICHAPWTLVEARVVADRTLTSWPSLETDIANAGAHWVDEEVVVCRNGPNVLITSRKPDDLKAFCRELIDAFSGATGS